MNRICIVAAFAAVSIVASAIPASARGAAYALTPAYAAYAAPCPYAYGFPSAYAGYNVIGYDMSRQRRSYRRPLR